MDGVDPSALLESVLAISVYMGELSGTGSTERRGGYALSRSDMPLPQANGMYVHGPQEDPALTDLPSLRELFAAEGRPFGVATIDGRTPAVERAAEAVGLREVSVDVAMTLPRADFQPTERPGLRIERVPASNIATWVELAADGFELPPAFFEATLSPSLLAVLDEPWIGSVIGWVDEVPVSTASYVTFQDSTLIFAVATPPEHRGQGFATAVTVDAIARGLAAGAAFAWLEAGPMGLRIYERLGFRAAWTSRCRAEPDDPER